ncbi:sensory rhodopsin transducer [Brevundimonas nasdae]|uniref:sensory rhodopsin transducer n=1 Tax=Brevundimonas nasdae TaxID=172043 RepID=UPI003016435E
MSDLGKRVWVIAEGYIPSDSTGPSPAMISHETACILNPGDVPTEVEITLFFEDREPVGPYRLVIGGQRTKHIRFNDLRNPEPAPRDTDYASIIRSQHPIVVQHTRLDSRQAANAIMTTIAYSE